MSVVLSAANTGRRQPREQAMPDAGRLLASSAGGRRLRWLLAAFLVVAFATAAVEGWWYWPGREKYTVAVPAPSASAPQVVLAYLRALDAHDRATAYALSTSAFRSTVAAWLSQTASITRIQIGKVQYYSKSPPARSPTWRTVRLPGWCPRRASPCEPPAARPARSLAAAGELAGSAAGIGSRTDARRIDSACQGRHSPVCRVRRASRNRRQIDSIIRVDRVRGSDSNDRREQRHEIRQL